MFGKQAGFEASMKVGDFVTLKRERLDTDES